jgi:hypothetical protein
MSAWVYQDPKQIKKVGTVRASWYVGWIDPEGKKCCKVHVYRDPAYTAPTLYVSLRFECSQPLLTSNG